MCIPLAMFSDNALEKNLLLVFGDGVDIIGDSRLQFKKIFTDFLKRAH